MGQICNQILLRGELEALPVFSHESHGRRFSRFSLAVERLSGAVDVLGCVAPEELVQALDPSGGGMIELQGQVRSFNNRSGEGRRLVITAYAEQLRSCEGEPANEVTLLGSICRPPVFRRTPLGREICDMILAVNRRYGRADYLPCIAWGAVAQQVSLLHTGARLTAEGRVQSRVYSKTENGVTTDRTAYEVSIMRPADRTEFPE